jgi:signal transduction histidine kinase
MNKFTHYLSASSVYGPLGDRRYREYPQFIVNSGQHLSNIINDILDLSRIEAGAIQPHFAPVTVSAEVAQCVEMVRERTALDRLNLVVNGDSASVIVCDRRLLRQIVLNLLSNAIKFTPADGTITVSWGTDAHDFVLRVADTGIGIAEEEIGRVVDPFTQVDSGLARRHEGVGLGLSIVKAFAEAQGATLHIDSALGRGTVVSIRFRQGPRSEKTAQAVGS